MNEAQIWTIIGVLGGAFVGIIAIMPTLFMHTLRAAIGGVESKIDALREEGNAAEVKVDAKFTVIDMKIESLDRRVGVLDANVDSLDARVGALDAKVAAMDRDVQVLMNRQFGTNRD